MEKVSAAARKNGLVAGAFGGSADVMKAYMKVGFTFFAAAVDVDLLHSGVAALLKAMRQV
jgi:2-keto-3-deoxy-L-rhamnonate aldolase RhmA